MTQEAKQRALEAFNRIVGVYKYHIIDDMEQDEDIVREYIVSQPATPECRHLIPKAMDSTTYNVQWRKFDTLFISKVRNYSELDKKIAHESLCHIKASMPLILECFSEIEWEIAKGGSALDKVSAAPVQ